MRLSTTQEIPGFRIVAVHGLAEGSVVQSKHLGRDIAAGLKSLVGGEIRGYSEMLQEARSEARNRMKRAAEQQGANAVVGVRYTTSAIAQNMSELLAYGTGVTIVPSDA
jgi:uncharacterized protein YbjQ (UPF0145 family)